MTKESLLVNEFEVALREVANRHPSEDYLTIHNSMHTALFIVFNDIREGAEVKKFEAVIRNLCETK